MYSVSEVPSKRSFASERVLYQEHSLSASPCHVQHQRLTQSTVWDVCIDSADERSCVVSCASGSSIVGDPAVFGTDDGLPTCEPQEQAQTGKILPTKCRGLFSHDQGR